MKITITIKTSINQEDILVANLHMPSVGSLYKTNTVRTLIDSNTIIVRDCNTPLIRANLYYWLFLLIYRTCHSIAIDYTFFSSAHRTFSGINHILGHKNKF
jgi:hypothetical protein